MPTNTLISVANPWTKAAHVIVDWSDSAKDITNADDAVEMDHLLRWVRTYPQRTSLHVYLRRSHRKNDHALQSQLQSLGCTVTMRSQQIVPR